MRALILGGTKEARDVAQLLVDRRWKVTSSLAGRVKNPRLPVGEVRIGGFGGPGGLAEWLREHDIDALIDATHPFAERISDSAATASQCVGIPLIALHREAWSPSAGDHWITVPSMERAAASAAGYQRVLLTIGRQQLAPFAADGGGENATWYLIRCVDPPEVPLPRNHEVLLSRGPFSLAGERALMESKGIDCLVTKNSGGAMTRPKLDAARVLGIPVVMVDRPPLPGGDRLVVTHSAEETLRALDERCATGPAA